MAAAMCRIRVTIVAILLGFCTIAEIAGAAGAEAWPRCAQADMSLSCVIPMLRAAPAIRPASGLMTAPLNAISAPRDAWMPQR